MSQINNLLLTCFMCQGLVIKLPCNRNLCLKHIPLEGSGVFWVRAGQAWGLKRRHMCSIYTPFHVHKDLSLTRCLQLLTECRIYDTRLREAAKNDSVVTLMNVACIYTIIQKSSYLLLSWQKKTNLLSCYTFILCTHIRRKRFHFSKCQRGPPCRFTIGTLGESVTIT